MAVGTVITKSMIDGQISAFGVDLNSIFSRIQQFNAALLAIGSTALQAAPYSYSSAESATLLAAAQDLDNMRKIFQGLMYVTAGATINTGVPTNNDGTHFGFPFNINVGKCDGFGF